MLELFTGNRNYSSWSMRPWVLMTQADVAFQDTLVRFDSFDPGSDFKRTLQAVSPVGKVPALLDEGFAVWDSLAIAEYLAEQFPDKHLWPRDPKARARARSVCAEMHAGFGALREHCTMNIEARLPQVGARLLQDEPAVRTDVERVVQLMQDALASHGGPLLFGDFSIADAFFAPVVLRFQTYAMPAPLDVQAYFERVRALPAVQAWVEQALAEHDFLAFEEPYRSAR